MARASLSQKSSTRVEPPYGGMSASDAELVARIQTGDTVAFEVLMRRHFRMAFLIAFAQLGNRADAEDLCQDAFVRCWERIGECRDPARVSAWLARMVRNMAHNRREFLQLRSTDALDPASHSSGDRTDSAAEREDLRRRLNAALRTLSDVQREVVLLHDLEGWKHDEIAERLGISTMMSRRHLSDARKRMRSKLADLATFAHDHD
jgi:RNA polymerase sigma-70 factor, ECF subfamily